MVNLIQLGLELNIFFFDLIVLGRIFDLASPEPQHVLVKHLNLILSQSSEPLCRVCGFVQHALVLDLLLQLGPLCL